jgi:uncharacterized surface protein with fasciclin (FAS1) repeats
MTALKRAAGAFALSLIILIPATAALAGNVVQEASKAGQFKTLIAAAKAAGLAGTLANTNGITVFAPTDAAFARLPVGTVESLLKPKNRGKLRAILAYHVIGKRVAAKDVPRTRTHVATLNGKSVSVRRSAFGVRVNGARVIAADVNASNGVIHVIDRVLLP